MSEGLEDTDVAVEMHSLLLSLAGFVDDELLGWCRELVAVGESDYAMELVVATVQADRVRLPGPLHDELHDSAVRRRVLGRAETLPPPDHSPRMRHRFTADPAEHGFPERDEDQSPEHALQSVPHRLLRDCQLWLTWRITPAGGASGPVPHPVVLIEVLDGAGADVLAYQVAEVLSRAGVFASVEVFNSGPELGDYHRAALADAQLIVSQEGHDELPFGEPSGPGGSGLGGAPNNGRNGTAPGPGHPRNAPLPNREPGRRPNPSAVSSNSDTGGLAVTPPEQDSPRRAPLHPVDRVITARGSAPRRPRPDNAERQPGSLDDVVAGLSFERGRDGAPSDDPFLADTSETSNGETPVESPPVEPPADRRAPSRDALWGPSRDGEGQPPAEGQQAREERPRPRPRSFPTAGRPNPPGPLPKRGGPPADPAETAESGLSDVEQRLLRQLHEELAAREDDEPSEGDQQQQQPPPRMFRGNGTNGGRKRRPS